MFCILITEWAKRRVDGGAMQVSLNGFSIDYYPFHTASKYTNWLSNSMCEILELIFVKKVQAILKIMIHIPGAVWACFTKKEAPSTILQFTV